MEKKESKLSAAAERRKFSTSVLGSDRRVTDDNSLRGEGRLGFVENIAQHMSKSWAKSCSRSKIDK